MARKNFEMTAATDTRIDFQSGKTVNISIYGADSLTARVEIKPSDNPLTWKHLAFAVTKIDDLFRS